MAILKRRRLMASGAEATPGDIETLDATDATCPVFDVMLQQASEMAERPMGGGFGHHPSVATNLMGRLTFKSHLFAGAATPPGVGLWLAGCGIGLTGAAHVADYLTPEAVGATTKSITFNSYQDGRLKRIHGAMGNAKITLPSSKLAVAEWDFQGVWNAPTDAALLAPTYIVAAPLKAVNATLTLGAYGDFCVANVVIDIGNTVYMRECVNATTGLAYSIITNRVTKITLDPEAALVATKDVFGEWLSGAEADLSVQCENSDGNTCVITVSDVQVINPQEAERNGLEVDQIECQANTDDLTFTFTA